ncbi:MAG: DNA polymerase/3'-5' exonuclease PolX [Candidatus Eremiobacteraeota bacterium]|nr:DNA polymerase/3'-5' exonuclease PolX [Candidatus Eremiobacteraeota bacterium]
MKNFVVAQRLNEIASLMEFDGEPFFKIKAYERAARSLEDSPTPVDELIRTGELEQLPGIGKAISQKVADIMATGTCKYLDELRAKFPPTILELLSVPGIGAKTAVALYRELGVSGLDDLRASIEDGSIARVPRLGRKTIENLKARLERLAAQPRRMRLGDAWPIAQAVVEALSALPFAKNVVAAGSLRRMERSVRDLDVICTSETPEKVLAAFVSLPIAERVSARGTTKATIWALPGISIDCRVVAHECFGNLLQHFTGNKEHNVLLREFAQRKGLKVSEYGIEDKDGKVITCPDEPSVYATLGLQFIPPEIRLGLDEIDLARRAAIPTLLELGDVRGDLHDHTEWSDGVCTIEQLARAAAQRNREYLSISDHSPGRALANGLSIERLREQIKIVASVREQYGVYLLRSSEVDIRADGSLDLPDEVLSALDIVVASIHSSFRSSKDQQTKRLLGAIENPYVTIVGHPTGELIEEREGYEFDVDTVFRAAARTGTALEINANPARLDLSADLARRARELGCTFSVDTDAHHIQDMDNMLFGVATARKAGISKEQVLNARPLRDVLEFVRKKRAALVR